ncbi:FG-GAP-like repeat-containing protein [uncultured Hymenobacter sp.]|uniref:FG-GAP-like repeat-containing protein n=1 Tax=uncultured Hymenobacter sp. TaxID=170016 RepID=UPI0035C99967
MLSTLRFALRNCFLLLAPAVAVAQAPTITATLPAANARAAARTGPVTVTFSQPLTASSAAALKVYSAQRGGLRSRGATPAVVSGNALTFRPEPYDFYPGEVVSVTTTVAAQAANGALLAAPRVQQFTVAVRGGTGGFGPITQQLAVGLDPFGLTAADLDGDGDLDFIVASNNSTSVGLNEGRGFFTLKPQPLPGGSSGEVVAADVDSDGDLDLLVPNRGSSVRVLLNEGQGSFRETPSLGLVSAAQVGRVAAADVDGDGDLDLLATNPGLTTGVSTVSVRFNDGSGAFSGGGNYPVGRGALDLVSTDVDNDGDLDLATASYDDAFGSTVSVRLNDGRGVFGGGGDYAVARGPSGLKAADLNGDGFVDLLMASSYNRPGAVSLRLNDGQGRFPGGSDLVARENPLDAAVADLNGDGHLDLLATSQGSSTVSAWLNGGDGTFGSRTDYVMGAGALGLVAADLDQDGDLDLLTADVDAGTVSIRLNGGTGLAAAGPSAAPARFSLAPNPAQGAVRATGLAAGQLVEVLDALGRTVGTATAGPRGEVTLPLPAGLPASVYVVRAGPQSVRLLVE